MNRLEHFRQTETETQPRVPVQLGTAKARWLVGFGGGLFLLAMFALIFSLSMHRRFSHDEHQFIASAVLVAREHLQPYRDFAYFHVPNQTYLWALFYHFTNYYLLVARTFCAVLGWLLLVVVFVITFQLWRGYAYRVRLGLAAVSTLFLVLAPIYSYTSGRAWNHDLPVLLTVLAFLTFVHGVRQPRAGFWLGFSGLLVGFAAATRLSFAPAVLPFVLALWLLPLPKNALRRRVQWTLWLGSGILLGVLPALYAFAQAPRAFIFGNLEYAELNTLYREVNDYEKGMTASGKFQFVVLTLLLREPGNLLLLLAYLGMGLPALRRDWRQYLWVDQLELTMIALLILSFLPGALLPTPAWPQYFYLFFPFFLLAALYGLRQRRPGWVKLPWFWGANLVAVILVAWLAVDEYYHVPQLLTPSEWFPVEFHEDSAQIADLLNVNRDTQVLTVSPTAAMEGDLAIYPEFVDGPFALRAGTFLSLPEQAAYKLVAPDQLDEWLGKERPDAILTGLNDRDAYDESPLVDFAQLQRYTPLPLGKGAFLWANPLAEWGNVVRLGTYTWHEAPVMPGESWPIILYLQSVAPIQHDLSITVRIVDAANHEWVHDERWPWGRPTTSWQPHDVWFDGHQLTMPADAPPGIYRVEMRFFDPDTQQLLPAVDLRQKAPLGDTFVLGYLSVGQPPAPRQELTPAVALGNMVKLLGTELDPTTPLQPGASVQVRVYWQATQIIHTDYTIFVHLLGPDGKLVAQQDQPPLAGFFPTSRWLPGQTTLDTYTLALPNDAPPGAYTLQVGWYQPKTGARLPVTRGGQPAGDTVEAATLLVK